MQLRLILLGLMALFFSIESHCQKLNENAFYLMVDEKEFCNSKTKKFYKSENKRNQLVLFTIKDCKNDTNEKFFSRKKSDIDTLNSTYIESISFTTIEKLNKINAKEKKMVFEGLNKSETHVSIFNKKPLFIIEKYQNKIIRYKVEWSSRVLQTTIEDD